MKSGQNSNVSETDMQERQANIVEITSMNTKEIGFDLGHFPSKHILG
jgi:hypothetical protein